MANADIKITNVRAIGPVRKSTNPFIRNAWTFDVVFTLETGTEQAGTLRTYTRKRDAVAELATLPKGVRNMAAIYQDGRFIGTSTRYGLTDLLGGGK